MVSVISGKFYYYIFFLPKVRKGSLTLLSSLTFALKPLISLDSWARGQLLIVSCKVFSWRWNAGRNPYFKTKRPGMQAPLGARAHGLEPQRPL